jgi:hypothetical protein
MRCERGHQVTVPLNTTGVTYYVEGCPGFMLGWMIEESRQSIDSVHLMRWLCLLDAS